MPILGVMAFGQRYNSTFTNSLDQLLLVVNKKNYIDMSTLFKTFSNVFSLL